MKVLLLAFLLLLSSFALRAQLWRSAGSDTLVRPYFFASGNFEWTTSGKVFRTSGFEMSLGVNVARLFTKKIVLGFFFENSLSNALSFTDDHYYLTDAVNQYFVTDYQDQFDLVRGEIVKEGFNHRDFHQGCYRRSGGIAFSPFPDRYGECLLLLSKGSNLYSLSGTYLHPDYGISDYSAYLRIGIGLKAQLVFKPFTLTKMSDRNWLKDHLLVGVYAQQIRFDQAVIGDRKIQTFLKPEFFTGNRRAEWQFGLRIGIGVGFLRQLKR